MAITKDKFVAIHYTLKDEKGEVLDSSVGMEPLGYIHGNGYLIPGLESQLEGKDAGEKLTAVVQPEDAYGTYDERLVTSLPRDRFQDGVPIEVGMKFQAMTPAGPSIVRVIETSDDLIKIDANHELAGKVLTFDVEIIEVRDATEEELAQLQSGGCGGCGGGCGGDCGSGDCGCGGGCGGCGQ